MKHLGTTQCCNHTFTSADIRPPLKNPFQAFGTKQRLWGGHAEWFSQSECPECGRRYWLWLQPVPRGYKVLTISAVDGLREENESIDLETADASQLRTWLRQRGVKFFNGASEEQLRELVAESLGA